MWFYELYEYDFLPNCHIVLSNTIFQRVHLDIQVGDHAIDYQDVANKEKLSELQLRVRQLLDQVEQIQKEQNYQRVSYCFQIPINAMESHSQESLCYAILLKISLQHGKSF